MSLARRLLLRRREFDTDMMNMRLSRVLPVVFFVTGTVSTAAVDFTLGPDIYVSPEGLDTNDGGAGSPLLTLREAIARANTSDDLNTILLATGTYSHDRTITVSQPAVVMADGEAVISAVINAQAHFGLDGVRVLQRGQSFSIGIRAGGYVQDCLFEGDPINFVLNSIAIDISSEGMVEIYRNVISDYGLGVQAGLGAGRQVFPYILRDNLFSFCGAGVLVNDTLVDGGTVDDPGGNVFDQCGRAISNVVARLQNFHGCQFLWREPASGAVYALLKEADIKELLVGGVKSLVVVTGALPLPPSPAGVEDVNYDGRVNAQDVQLIILAALDILRYIVLDVNDDGVTNAVDVQTVILAALAK